MTLFPQQTTHPSSPSPHFCYHPLYSHSCSKTPALLGPFLQSGLGSAVSRILVGELPFPWGSSDRWGSSWEGQPSPLCYPEEAALCSTPHGPSSSLPMGSLKYLTRALSSLPPSSWCRAVHYCSGIPEEPSHSGIIPSQFNNTLVGSLTFKLPRSGRTEKADLLVKTRGLIFG